MREERERMIGRTVQSRIERVRGGVVAVSRAEGGNYVVIVRGRRMVLVLRGTREEMTGKRCPRKQKSVRIVAVVTVSRKHARLLEFCGGAWDW